MTDERSAALILLASFNGGKYLEEQLASFLAQTYKRWNLLVSDDGSSDDTTDILAKFRAEVGSDHEVTIVSGPGSGCTDNFLSLIKRIPKGTSLVALSDQDDVWLPEKLEKGRIAIESATDGEQPVLYCASSFICNETLDTRTASPAFRRDPSFENALVQSIGGGNTMMLNGPAIRLIQAAAQEVGDVVIHDWWIYQIITGCGGTVIRKDIPVLYYRQHDKNVIGANSSIRGKLHRILFVAGRQFSKWNEINIAALSASRHRFTPEARKALAYFSEARHGGLIKRLKALYRSGAVRQTSKGTLALYLACATRKL
ncbi:glycosyltransferase [Litoreibacter arenae]|uniref:Alpha-L-Rha alpha-1,3-L-rhamnosyltransferase n=1 Tax=Litoreibacter arenae DSM 19593 TaxID=1123360 RepID=S9QF67_9RHOB|nr:glycosyltransferase [Litoreibacter arenae]EPX78537.1 Alpha-L-Rha alpha-1,3-L-rhamnosyltransferase [Litoreibacter arenae DSM 19593]